MAEGANLDTMIMILILTLTRMYKSSKGIISAGSH